MDIEKPFEPEEAFEISCILRTWSGLARTRTAALKSISECLAL